MKVLDAVLSLLFGSSSQNKIGNGVNLQPSYYNNGAVTFGWDLMKNVPEIKSVRIEIEPDKVSQAWDWIHQATSHGYKVIATYHKYTVLGSDDPKDLKDAGHWWANNYKYLSGAGPFTVNLMNEWGSHEQTVNSYSSAYNSAISLVRSVYNGPIILDIPGWGQNTVVAKKSAAKITDKNIIFSAHIYPQGWNAGANRNVVPSDIDDLVDSGRDCLIGEYGTGGDGPVDVIAVVNHAKKVGCLGILAWAWNGDGGKMNMVQPTWSNNPTSSSYSKSNYFKDVVGPL